MLEEHVRNLLFDTTRRPIRTEDDPAFLGEGTGDVSLCSNPPVVVLVSVAILP